MKPLEWETHGFEWSIVNYGPGTLWFSFTPGVIAAVGATDSSELRKGFSFTDSASALRYLELSLVADAPLTYVLDTNQRVGGRAPAGIEEAPVDGGLYVRCNGKCFGTTVARCDSSF